MAYQLIYSSNGATSPVNTTVQDTSLVGQLKTNVQNSLVYSISSIELGLFTPNNYANGAFGNIFSGVNQSLSASLNGVLKGISTDPIVGKFLPGAIRGLANPVFNLISGIGNATTGALQNFARESLVAPTTSAINDWFSSSGSASSGASSTGWFSNSGDTSTIMGSIKNAAITSANKAQSSFTSNITEAAGKLPGSLLDSFKSAFFGSPNANTGAYSESNITVSELGCYANVYNDAPPKQGFLFKVAFFINEPYASQMGAEFYRYVHSTDLPKLIFEYEQVNMYNYKTEVLKSTDHEDMNMTFYDDTSGFVQQFVNAYRRAYVPITRGTDTKALDARFYPLYAMDFNDSPNAWYASESSLLSEGNINVISHIIISHVYHLKEFHQTQYLFTNPRIKKIDYGDLNYNESKVSEIKISWGYDTFFIESSTINDTPMFYWGNQDLFYKKTDNAMRDGGGEDTPFAEFDLNSLWSDKNANVASNQDLLNQINLDAPLGSMLPSKFSTPPGYAVDQNLWNTQEPFTSLSSSNTSTPATQPKDVWTDITDSSNAAWTQHNNQYSSYYSGASNAMYGKTNTITSMPTAVGSNTTNASSWGSPGTWTANTGRSFNTETGEMISSAPKNNLLSSSTNTVVTKNGTTIWI